MNACGAVVGGRSIEGVDLSKQAVIQGVVQKNGDPVSVGYVRLLDQSDEFVAEVPVSANGEFRFFAAAGKWKVVTLVPGGSAHQLVVASLGEITDLNVIVS